MTERAAFNFALLLDGAPVVYCDAVEGVGTAANQYPIRLPGGQERVYNIGRNTRELVIRNADITDSRFLRWLNSSIGDFSQRKHLTLMAYDVVGPVDYPADPYEFTILNALPAEATFATWDRTADAYVTQQIRLTCEGVSTPDAPLSTAQELSFASLDTITFLLPEGMKYKKELKYEGGENPWLELDNSQYQGSNGRTFTLGIHLTRELDADPVADLDAIDQLTLKSGNPAPPIVPYTHGETTVMVKVLAYEVEEIARSAKNEVLIIKVQLTLQESYTGSTERTPISAKGLQFYEVPGRNDGMTDIAYEAFRDESLDLILSAYNPRPTEVAICLNPGDLLVIPAWDTVQPYQEGGEL